MSAARVDIIILNWGGSRDTFECLESLRKVTYPNYRVTVLDNGSGGNDANDLETIFAGFINLIRESKNRGFAGGNNICIGQALTGDPPDYFLLLNNDTVVRPDFLDNLVRVIEANPLIGIAGPKVYYHGLPGRIQTAGVKMNTWTGGITPIGRGQRDKGQYDDVKMVRSVMGCCMLIKTGVISKIGLLDVDYFCYHEETDYCLRATKAGFKIAYVPDAVIWHKTPVRVKPWQSLPGDSRSGAMQTYYLTRNLFLLEKKHAGDWQYRTFLTCFFAFKLWYMVAVCVLYYGDLGRLSSLFQGVVDGLRGKTGPRT
jgi:GT2 family glycosyltransferase